MRFTLFLSTALLALVIGTTASASVSFTLDSYDLNVNSSGPGLLIKTEKILAEPTSFTLDVGDMFGFTSLFRIWTDETTVNGDDKVPQDISVDFNFSLPAPAFGGSVEGATVGGKIGFFGIIHVGDVEWDAAPTVISFGPNGDGELQVELTDERFFLDRLGLGLGKHLGKNVEAKFTLLKEATPGDPPPGVVPEPSTLAVWSLLCACGMLTARRRRS